ncbi:MAG: flagellar biosynthesis regulator FlaF [Thermodesulfovibrionales bacterium]|nr:flagellar biosynthesis regulator FlaF [Thermodesulfovibrionales bacterium]
MLRISDLKRQQTDTTAGREIEAQALEKAAAGLQHCKDVWETEKNIRELLFEALRYNQTIWTLFVKEAENSANPLSQDLKNNIIALGNFINKRTFEIQSFPTKEKLTILIEINKNIAKGLRGSPSD